MVYVKHYQHFVHANWRDSVMSSKRVCYITLLELIMVLAGASTSIEDYARSKRITFFRGAILKTSGGAVFKR